MPTIEIGRILAILIVFAWIIWYTCTMPLGKKAYIPLVPTRRLKKELEYLYARRSAVDLLIESLERYDRFRVVRGSVGKRPSV
jgi:hypothetical protein